MDAAQCWALCFVRCQTEEQDDLSHHADCVSNLAESPEDQQRYFQHRQKMETDLQD